MFFFFLSRDAKWELDETGPNSFYGFEQVYKPIRESYKFMSK